MKLEDTETVDGKGKAPCAEDFGRLGNGEITMGGREDQAEAHNPKERNQVESSKQANKQSTRPNLVFCHLNEKHEGNNTT